MADSVCRLHRVQDKMVLTSLFGKKPSGGGKSADDSRPGKTDRGDVTTSLEFTHVGDIGRSLAAAAGKIQVLEVSVEDVAAIEEAAVLYANANDSGAKEVLEEALDGASKSSDRLWRMLFDLYRLMGDRPSFEARGVVFAELFEKSPPIWDEATPVAAAPAAPKDAAPAVNLSGNLSGNARPQFEQLVRIGAKMGKLRIDLSRLRGVDEAGATLLSDTLDALRRAKVKVALLGARQAFSLLEPQLKVGEPQGRVFWLCALAMLQQLGEQAPFEDMAVNFAITFEESPPSWDPPEILQSSPTDTGGITPKAEEGPLLKDGFVMDGVVAGGQPEVLRKLAVYGSERNAIEIDASKLKRLEFVSAGALFNQLATFQTQGKLNVIHHPNEMVAALMRVMGIDQVAQIEHKKF
ncbi:STAS domain-containing protein [Uliginosibacterium sp. TH139]|uniref:STAS domain-containing protein n=1 Tax=Uliginosibacterium sp. TH139 TaxID=2067453 RepID=UPI00117FB408|nr:STAS domain-containing protein [Uliginosibacterium sp. TH139]